MIIDLRSDTVTHPTSAMRNAMQMAEVGDDVFSEDPTINLLEDRMAKMFGMQKALFCPTATMSNQIALKVHTQPMDEIICDWLAHIYQYEVGGYAFISGCSIKYVHSDRGILTPNLIKKCINPKDVHKPVTRLVCIENSCNKGGGSTYTIENIKAISAVCRENNLALHVDGARIFNALIHTKDNAMDYDNYIDTITVCLSKGLGCPAGALLIGSEKIIEKARRIRKVLGGGMRQAGIIAAAGLYALEHHIPLLQKDHQHAKEIALTLNECAYVKHILPVETNIILFQLHENVSDEHFISFLAEHNILAFATGDNNVRFVTHLDIHSQMIPEISTALLHFHPI